MIRVRSLRGEGSTFASRDADDECAVWEALLSRPRSGLFIEPDTVEFSTVHERWPVTLRNLLRTPVARRCSANERLVLLGARADGLALIACSLDVEPTIVQMPVRATLRSICGEEGDTALVVIGEQGLFRWDYVRNTLTPLRTRDENEPQMLDCARLR
ncbi:MAG: hypothetical protein U0326_31105 [Polyangiales bacterium]